MLIQCILVYIILYFNILHQYKIGNYIFLKNSRYNELNYYYIIFTDTRICVNDSLNPLQWIDTNTDSMTFSVVSFWVECIYIM